MEMVKEGSFSKVWMQKILGIKFRNILLQVVNQSNKYNFKLKKIWHLSIIMQMYTNSLRKMVILI